MWRWHFLNIVLKAGRLLPLVSSHLFPVFTLTVFFFDSGDIEIGEHCLDANYYTHNVLYIRFMASQGSLVILVRLEMVNDTEPPFSPLPLSYLCLLCRLLKKRRCAVKQVINMLIFGVFLAVCPHFCSDDSVLYLCFVPRVLYDSDSLLWLSTWACNKCKSGRR